MVNGAHDVRDYRLRGVINTSHFSHFEVIRSEEGLIEVHHRVSLSCALAEVLKDCLHISLGKQLCQVIHQPGNAVVEIRPGDVVEELSQKWVGFRQEIRSILSGKALASRICAPSGKKPIGNGLGIHISKLLHGEVGYQVIPEICQLSVE